MEGASVQELLKERPDIRIDSRVPTAALLLPGAARIRSCNRIHQNRTTSRPTQMHALRRRLLVLAAAVWVPSIAYTQVLFSDDLTTRSNWLNSGNSGVSLVGGALSVTAGQHVLAFFTPEGSQRAIGNNESLHLTFGINFSSVANSLTGFRVGLFDSNGATRPTTDGVSTAFQLYDGYLFSMNTSPTVGAAERNSLRLRVRQPGSSATTALMSSFSSSSAPVHTTYVSVGTGGTDPALQIFQTGIDYQATYSISRGSGASLTFTFSLTGGNLINFTNSLVVSSPSTYAFDAFALYAVGGTSNFAIDNVTLTAVPEPSTYAACAGAAVLGLAFWRRRRAAAKALAA